jgi:hypothetical protein
MLLTYDPEARNYPGVMMQGPSRSVITGTWDEKTQTMSFTGSLADGNKLVSTHRFIDKDHAEPAGVITNAAGEVLVELSWKQTKRSDKALPPEPGIDELLASYLKVIGGMKAHKRHTTRTVEGTMTFPGAADPIKMTITAKAPNLNHVTLDVPGFGEVREGFDGKRAWKSSPGEGVVQVQGEELEIKRRNSNFYRYLDLKSDFKTLTYVGRETVKGVVYDVVKATGEDGYEETIHFDARTHLMHFVKRPDAAIEMGGYRKVDGIMMASSIVVAAGGVEFAMTIKEVSFEEKVDDALFAMPEK